jgi:hypothetical protein
MGKNNSKLSQPNNSSKHKVGKKKKAKLTAEAMEKLKKDTYCKCATSLEARLNMVAFD